MNKKISIIIATYNRANDMVACLDSILASDYKNYEIIVVDNASTDNTIELLEQKYGNKIKLIKSDTNLMAGGGRNFGAKYATGEYFLFIDSDNIVDFKMINELIKGIEKIKDAGMVGPIMHYYKEPTKIWWAGADINLLTSKTSYIGLEETDRGQCNEIKKVGHVPNVFMIKKKIWDKVGGIDSNFVMHYEESDLAEKIRKIGYNAYIIPTAKTLHNVPLNSEQNSRNYGGESKKRTYYTARNRILFMRKNAPKLNFIAFLLIFNNIFLMIYCFNYLKNKKMDSIKFYLKGTFDGIINK